MEITYHLSQFDGPLDMLLFMLDKAKIDIRDIRQISRLTSHNDLGLLQRNQLGMQKITFLKDMPLLIWKRGLFINRKAVLSGYR